MNQRWRAIDDATAPRWGSVLYLVVLPYSARSVVIGSTAATRRAGITVAIVATRRRRTTPDRRIPGSRTFPCAHFEIRVLSEIDNPTPTTMPPPTLPSADEKTS